MKTVLITGASGFVGRGLCRRILSDGCTVRGAVRSDNAKQSLPDGVKTFNTGPIGPATDWSKALNDVDTVVHLAARVHLMSDKTADPLARYRHVNVAATRRLAEMAGQAGCRRIVFMSSVKVNGEERDAPYTEKDKPMPNGPYAVSKWEAEQVLHEISDKTGLETVILRPPLVYGPGVKANFLRLLKTVEQGIPLPFASIDNRRSMICLGNLIDAVVTVAEHPKAAGNTYLVSDGDDVSTPDLIRRLGSALRCPARLFPFSTRAMRIAGRIMGKTETVERLIGTLTVNREKIQHELDWKVPFTMKQGLEDTAKWYLNLATTA